MSHHAGRSDLILFSFSKLSQAAEGWLASRLGATTKRMVKITRLKYLTRSLYLNLVDTATNITGGGRDDNIGTNFSRRIYFSVYLFPIPN